MWGENPQNEYGGPAAAAKDNVLTRRWLEEFGGLLGLRVSDLVGRTASSAKHLIQYTYPTDDELADVGVTGIFLGYYMPWDGWANALIAQAHGFETWPHRSKARSSTTRTSTTLRPASTTTSSSSSTASAAHRPRVHARPRGRLSRADAVELVKRHDGKFPWTYLGVSLEEILADIDMTFDEFIAVCDRFTNKRLFVTDRHGELVRDDRRNLTKINYDNVRGMADVTDVAVVDYGMCNLDSVRRALEECGATPSCTDDPPTSRRPTASCSPASARSRRDARTSRSAGLDEALVRRGVRRVRRSSASASACS